MAEAPNKSKRRTDTDDSVVHIFPPREAAELLGRTYLAVIARRNEKGLGRPHGSKKPRKQLRRQYFSTGQGPREEIVPPPPIKCRYCDGKPTRRGLCKKCYRWVQRLVEAGVVTWELAGRLWLGGVRESRQLNTRSASRCHTSLRMRGAIDDRSICTSHVERNNGTLRTFMKRFCRLTNGFSRKLENLEAAVNLHMAYYHFCWRPGMMRVTPAQAAGLTDHCWTFDELLA